MHQYTRGVPRPMAGATSPQSHSTRTHSQRTQPERDSSESFSYADRPGSDAANTPNATTSADKQAKEADKIRQVTQNFFRRAALEIVSSRVTLTPEIIEETGHVRSSKWFQIVFDESQEISDEAADWTMVDVLTHRPKPMVIEIYLDTSELRKNQTVVVLDERKNKWDVCEALRLPGSSGNASGRRQRSPIVVLERWKVYLGEPPPSHSAAASEPMSSVYKKLIILFRSLFTYCRFLPAWKFTRQLASQSATLATLRPMFRILDQEPPPGPRDPLTAPLYPSPDKTTQSYLFNPVGSPLGSYNVQVTYRVNCDFRVENSDALLSSHFMGIDDQHFQASLGNTSERRGPYTSGGHEVGSLPIGQRWSRDASELTHAYGSMSTFHHQGHGTGTSPISALRAAREMAEESQDQSPRKSQLSERTLQNSKSSTRPENVIPASRRISVSFQPFKQGSLSSSPAAGIMAPPSPSSASTAKPSELSRDIPKQPQQIQHSRASSLSSPLTANPAQSAATTPEVTIGSPGSASPKAPTITRYSSSFGHRRSRISSDRSSASKADDDNNSSGKASQSSSNQPGSGLLGEVESGSPGSAQTDDDNISDFLKLLQDKKELKSFNRSDDVSRDASTRRTTAALSKFRGMRDSNAALGDSLSSSMMLQRSSSSSSRQLPPLVGASVSTSSSPGKAISPHTPYTPSVPSRLSEHSTIRREESRVSIEPQPQELPASSEVSVDSIAQNNGSGAIPIPPSPRRTPFHRRSSSAHQRLGGPLEAPGEYDRPASFSGQDRHELTLSELLHTQQTAEQATPLDESGSRDGPSGLQPRGSPMGSQEGERTQSSANTTSSSVPRSSNFRSRINRRGSGSSNLGRGAARYSFSNRPGLSAGDDEEPLLFYMSEIGRRSIEDIDPTAPSNEAGATSATTSAGAATPSASTPKAPIQTKGLNRS